MAFNIKGSHVVAIVIAAAIGGWMYTGKVVVGGQSNEENNTTIAEREVERSAKLFKVRFVKLVPEQRFEELVVRGKTQASALVPVRAQVGGILEQRLVRRGDSVRKNQIVCKVDTGARAAQLDQAKAQMAKAEADFQANSKLVKKGFASKNKLKTMKASLDAAKAGVTQAKLNMERSDIRASASGVVQDPIAEVGDMLNPGSSCITLVQANPMKFSGQISERDIDKVTVGAKANVQLVSGRIVEGVVRYISPSANVNTRTFLSEIEIANDDLSIRDGMTARARIKLQPVEAFRISPSWINLSDEGEIGVRTLDEQDRVHFVEVDLVAQTKNGYWVRGLKAGMKVITLGQEYVIDGEKVIAIADSVKMAKNVEANK